MVVGSELCSTWTRVIIFFFRGFILDRSVIDSGGGRMQWDEISCFGGRLCENLCKIRPWVLGSFGRFWGFFGMIRGAGGVLGRRRGREGKASIKSSLEV